MILEFWIKIVKIFPRTYTYRILTDFWQFFTELYLYILAAILIAALIEHSLPRIDRFRFLKSDRTWNIFAATLLGMAAPLSVYVAVPMSAALIASGIPLPVMVAFLFACPLIDPGLFLLTLGALGWQMALARVLAAFSLGFGAGLLAKKFGNRLRIKPNDNLTAFPEKHSGGSRQRGLINLVWRRGIFIVKIFSVSLLLSSAIKALVSPEYVRSLLGGPGNFSILLAIGLGIPFYQCGGASIPIMEALYELGMSKGAILAFFISGPATKIPAIYAFSEGYGIRFLLFYLLYTLSGAFAAGIIFNLIR